MDRHLDHLLYGKSWKSSCVHLIVLVVLVSVTFSNILGNTYHLDSLHRVKDNSQIDELWPPWRFFTDIRAGSTRPQTTAYRPLMPLSHAINNEIAAATGTSKLAGFHFGNIAIHIGSAILVYFLFSLLIARWGTGVEPRTTSLHYSHKAFAATLIFAVHPIAGSAVNYIAARDLLLMVFFFVASMLVYFSMRRSGDTLSGWAASLLLLSLAILSKQAAIVGFGLVFLFELILVNVRLTDWRLWARTILFAVPTAAYSVFHWVWINKQIPYDPLRVPLDIHFPLTMAKAHLFYYMKNFVWPFEMRALAKFDLVQTINDPYVLVGSFFIILTLVVAWVLRKRDPLISFAIFAYWLLFALTASVFPFKSVVTDYRQYLPSIFLALPLVLVCFSFKQQTFSVTLMTALVSYFSVSSYHINQNWKTEESFWQQSITYGAVALAHHGYASAVSRENPELAERHYLEAIRQEPTHIYANISLGLLHIRSGKREEGLNRLRRVVTLFPEWALAHYWLSQGLKLVGEMQESLEETQKAADLDPMSLKYQYAVARELQGVGRHSEAIKYFKRIMELNPGYEATGFLLGLAYQKNGQPQDAIDMYNWYLKRNPDHAQSHFNLAYQLMDNREYKVAINHFQKALKIQPSYREIHVHLSTCYRNLGDEFLAKKHQNESWTEKSTFSIKLN